MFILGSTFRVYADTIILKESQFRPVGSFVVSNHNLAERYMKSVFDSLSTYTVGTGFKVKEGSTNARLVDNTGIWVG